MMVFFRAAIAVWGDMIQEYFNVDSSGDMNDLASLLLRGGNEEMEIPIKGVFYRQFLPASHTVCPFTLQFYIKPNCVVAYLAISGAFSTLPQTTCSMVDDRWTHI
jgi:hypothetical protein